MQDEAEKKAGRGGRRAIQAAARQACRKMPLKRQSEDVRVTSRLVDSPACLVVVDDGMSTQPRACQAGRPERAGIQACAGSQPEHPLVKKPDGSVHFHDRLTSFSTRPCWPKGLVDDPAACRAPGECLLALMKAPCAVPGAARGSAVLAGMLRTVWPVPAVVRTALRSWGDASRSCWRELW